MGITAAIKARSTPLTLPLQWRMMDIKCNLDPGGWWLMVLI